MNNYLKILSTIKLVFILLISSLCLIVPNNFVYAQGSEGLEDDECIVFSSAGNNDTDVEDLCEQEDNESISGAIDGIIQDIFNDVLEDNEGGNLSGEDVTALVRDALSDISASDLIDMLISELSGFDIDELTTMLDDLSGGDIAGQLGGISGAMGGAVTGYEIFPPESTISIPCAGSCGCMVCPMVIPMNHTALMTYNWNLFRSHRIWLIDTFFTEHIRFAMSLMTNQMTAVAMQQAKIIGTFFDAKHQLETQRLFQQLMAEAHKDYQPSEGMCDIGTTARGLATADRKSAITHQTLANHVMNRQLRSGENLTMEDNSDLYSRIDVFKERFCYVGDNSNNLKTLCIDGSAPRRTRNQDVDFTRAVESKLTVDIDYTLPGLRHDEVSVFALMSNLFANDVLQGVGNRVLADGEGNPSATAYKYMNLRSVAAKRSVAQNSMSAIIAERASGDRQTEYAPFVKSTIVELGFLPEETAGLVGRDPSYFSQMEVLTKKLYQNPVFYTELYDKPTNVLRKRAALRAISLMQDRDHFKSLLRSEAVLSVILESMLNEEHDRVYKRLKRLQPGEDPITE